MDTFTIWEQKQVTAAEGWLELGNHIEANEELEKVSASHRWHPMVLRLRWQIYAKTGKWEACVDIAAAHVAACGEDPEGWINRSYALHELKRTQEALELLEPAAYHFPSVSTIPYNMACYSCQLGNLDEAWEWLEVAFEAANNEAAIKTMALDDKHLEPLWAEIGAVRNRSVTRSHSPCLPQSFWAVCLPPFFGPKSHTYGGVQGAPLVFVFKSE